MLQHTIAGAGNLRYESRAHRVRPGETMLLILPHNHRYWLEDGGRWSFFWISMHGEEALTHPPGNPERHRSGVQAPARYVDHLADCTLRLINGGADRPGSAPVIAYEAATALYDDVFGSHPVASGKAARCNMCSTISGPISTSRCRSRNSRRCRA